MLETKIQTTWETIQKEIYAKFAPMIYFEFGEESCKFEKDGKYYEVKIKEATSLTASKIKETTPQQRIL
jgi:hypothetical protein